MRCFNKILSEQQNTAVALGFFDGLHLGHRKVISLAAAERQNGLLPVCFTFAQSPKSVIGGKPAPALMTRNDKLKTLEELGMEHVYFADFKMLMNLSAEEFVREIPAGKLRAKKLFCGFNYRFGKNARGDTALLQRLCGELKIELTVVPPETLNGQVVSSTLIKKQLADGNVTEANRMLCGKFGFCGAVEHGRRLGRRLGTPTINLQVNNELILPKFGVYASVVTLENGGVYCGVTNVGVKPTVSGTTPLWETWMPNYSGGEIYGQKADVRLLEFIRPEKKFENLDSLKAEIVKNSVTAMGIFDRQLHKNTY